ncbi:MAG: hypothetical protein IKP47_07345 [Ruminococcus sp.]|nr:hypothetical protein [Ruminococcus sp.]
MKITSFNPLVLSNNADAAIKVFEDLGFVKRHSITINENGKDITTVRMKNEGGFYVDVSQVDGLPRDMTLIRMNVDNFDEAYKFLLSKGFTNPKGDHTVDTRTNKSCMMKSPTGFAFDLCQHIKE